MSAMAMMDIPLNSWLLFDHGPRYFHDTEVVTRFPDGSRHRYTYADFGRRAQQLMHALDALALPSGARVATLAWNGYRHLEAYWAVPCTGRVLHTLNVRLSADELAYIVKHADDRVVLVDADLLPLLEQVAERGGLAGVDHVVVLADRVPPGTTLPGALAYEELIAAQPVTYEPREIDERSPLGLCYTSGTTGQAQGRGLHPPLDHAARPRRILPGRDVHRPGRRRASGGADVPRQRLGPALHRHPVRRQAGVLRRAAGRGGARGADGRGARDRRRRRADRVDGRGGRPRRPRRRPAGRTAPAVRRGAAGARTHRPLPHRVRHPAGADLGHDGDVTARQLRLAEGAHARLGRGTARGRRPRHGGAAPAGGADADPRRGRAPAALGRRVDGRTAGARALGGGRTSGRRAAGSSPRTAGSSPATSRPARPTATSSSPTAPRTSSSRAGSGSPRSTWSRR